MTELAAPRRRPTEAMTTSAVRAALSAALDRVWDLADEADTAHAPGQMSMSRVGHCARQSAYRLAGHPFDPGLTDRSGRAARLGTWLHDPILRFLCKALPGRARREVPLTLTVSGITLRGRTDLVWRTVSVDLKTCRDQNQLSWLRRGDDVKPAVRAQVATYALAREQSGDRVSHIAYAYVDRAEGGTAVVVEAFTDDLRALVTDRLAALSGWAFDPDLAPREEHGPGLSWMCDGCPWLRSCWGATAEPGVVGPQTDLLGREIPAIVDALAAYSDAQGAESRAKQEKQFVRAVLSDTDAGTYGSYKLSWGRSGGAFEDDVDAMAERLRELGEPVPQRWKSRQGAIRVTLVKDRPREVTR